jgi:glyoxylase-like metal-dependent hydrolase (beta-lactamase superfamily II)
MRRTGITLAVSGLLTAAGLVCQAPPLTITSSAQQATEGRLEVIQLRPNFYVIAGAGGNIGVHVGPRGTIVVDSGSAGYAERTLALIESLSKQKQGIRYIINTSADADHVGGNATLAKAGRNLMAAGPEPPTLGGLNATVLAAEPVLIRMSAPTGEVPPFPQESWPIETYAELRKELYLDGEGIQIHRELAAHSDGDSVVLFRQADVVVAGDIIDTTRFPVIDLARGGSIQGEINALNHVLDLSVRAVPLPLEGGGTYIVPGHGRIYDKIDAIFYRDMVVTIRDVIAGMKQRGMTLEQVKAARPAKPWERQYGATSGSWTTDHFVEAVYKSLDSKSAFQNQRRPLAAQAFRPADGRRGSPEGLPHQ